MSSMMLALVIGYLLDLVFGDPHWLWHPVIGIGKFISFTERKLRLYIKISSKDTETEKQKKEIKIGILLVVAVCILTAALPFALLWVAFQIHPYFKIGLESIMCYQILATKSLKTESMKVYQRLQTGDLAGGRIAVSMIVGRDTEQLEEEGIIKASVETIAENTSDGVIAPIFYMFLFGAVGGFLYKAINTMDSMVGYKNESYLYVGRAAAKLDDFVNFIPARISAIYMIMASWILGLNWKNAIHIFKRDRFNHASPNSAQTETVCAGALGIQLAGDAYYFGKLCKKKTIGDSHRLVCVEDIRIANRMLYVTSAIAMLVVIFFACLVHV